MRPQIISIIGLLFLVISCKPTQKLTEQPVEVIKGVLVKKPWSKTTQSYCAQGSDYWVIKEGDKENVIAWSDEKLAKKAEGFRNKTVTLKGVWTPRTITPPENEISQHPVGANGESTFECVVFSVFFLK